MIYTKEYERLKLDTNNFVEVVLMTGQKILVLKGSELSFSDCGYEDQKNGEEIQNHQI